MSELEELRKELRDMRQQLGNAPTGAPTPCEQSKTVIERSLAFSFCLARSSISPASKMASAIVSHRFPKVHALPLDQPERLLFGKSFFAPHEVAFGSLEQFSYRQAPSEGVFPSRRRMYYCDGCLIRDGLRRLHFFGCEMMRHGSITIDHAHCFVPHHHRY